MSASNPLAGDPITNMRFSTDGVSYGPWTTYSSSASVTLPAGDGAKHVYVEVENVAGTISSPAVDTIVLDQTPPTVTRAPTPSIRLVSLSPAGAGITMSWTATDATSGVKSYTLQEQVNGGAWVNVSLANPGSNSVNLTLAPGNSYKFRVSASDKAGNASAYSAGVGFTLTLLQENNSAVSYSPGWTRQVLSGSSGGSVTSRARPRPPPPCRSRASRSPGCRPLAPLGRGLGDCRWRLPDHGYHSRRHHHDQGCGVHGDDGLGLAQAGRHQQGDVRLTEDRCRCVCGDQLTRRG